MRLRSAMALLTVLGTAACGNEFYGVEGREDGGKGPLPFEKIASKPGYVTVWFTATEGALVEASGHASGPTASTRKGSVVVPLADVVDVGAPVLRGLETTTVPVATLTFSVDGAFGRKAAGEVKVTSHKGDGFLASYFSRALEGPMVFAGESSVEVAPPKTVLWADEGRVYGASATALRDVDWVVLTAHDAVGHGKCGPYLGAGNAYAPKTLHTKTMAAVDRRSGRRKAERVFPPAGVSCPEVASGTMAQGLAEIEDQPSADAIDQWIASLLR